MEHGKRLGGRWRLTAVIALAAVVGVMLVAQPAGAHFLASIDHIWHHLKPKVNAQIDQRASRVAFKAENINVPVAVDEGDLVVITIKVPGPPGGTRFVKVDAQITGIVSSTTTCPCQAIFHVTRDGGLTSQQAYLVLHTLAGGFDEDSAAITLVEAVPSGTTQTFRLTGREFQGSETIAGRVAISAITANFGHTGGSVLRPTARPPAPGE